jgi:hypothetical protein
MKCEACKQYLPFSTFASHKLVNLCGNTCMPPTSVPLLLASTWWFEQCWCSDGWPYI